MENPYPLIVLSPVLAMVLNVGAHLVVNRLRRHGNPMVNLVLAFAAGGAALVWINLAVSAALMEMKLDAVLFFLLNCGTYAALGFCYFAFINLNLASLRIRMMKEINAAPERSLSLDAILGKHDGRAVVDARLDRLTRGEHVKFEGDRFVPGPNPLFRWLALMMDVLKWVILGRKIEKFTP